MKVESGFAQISVVTTHEAEEPIAALLERIFQAPVAIYTNIVQGYSVVTLYAQTSTQVLQQPRDELLLGFADLRQLGLDLGNAEILVRKVPREDWSESWKKHFKPLQIGSALLIKPSWSKQQRKPKQALVVLDPGLSFGTGQHATTSFCLRQIVAAGRSGQGPLALLDAGCGSGILAISAAKLGYAPVEAFDFDPVAVRIARKNSHANHVDRKVKITRQDLTRLASRSRKRFDVICANLVSELLISERDKLLGRLSPNGTIVLAGILETEFAKVRAAYESVGLRLLETKIEREWQSGSFRNASSNGLRP